MRNVRVKVDENVPAALPGQKTIHQRNKSSPALSTMPGAPGLKAPPKRTAFGDVSNTINGVRSMKDDGAIPLKQGVQANDQPVSVVADKKATIFLRQASRPYSVSNLRGLLTGATGIASTEPLLNPAAVETNTLANSRKAVTKRPATTIFKDVTLPAIQETASKSLTEAQLATTSIPFNKPSSVPVSSKPNQTGNLQSQPVPASDASLDDPGRSSVQPNTVSSEVEDSAALRSDGIYIDDKGNVQVYQEVQPEPEDHIQTTYHPSKPLPAGPTKLEIYPAPGNDVLPCSYASIAGNMPRSRIAHEEYWEEEDDENYEEEGYVTARSFRSRGENTTGGATTVLFPQVNQRIKREIEAAKYLVEAERTPEEIEEECFDTSMVAEYGDEIFDYMRALEVSRHVLAFDAEC